jgi:hypothetical protein
MKETKVIKVVKDVLHLVALDLDIALEVSEVDGQAKLVHLLVDVQIKVALGLSFEDVQPVDDIVLEAELEALDRAAVQVEETHLVMSVVA